MTKKSVDEGTPEPVAAEYTDNSSIKCAKLNEVCTECGSEKFHEPWCSLEEADGK